MNRKTSCNFVVFLFAMKRMKLVKNDTKFVQKYLLKVKNPEQMSRVFVQKV